MKAQLQLVWATALAVAAWRVAVAAEATTAATTTVAAMAAAAAAEKRAAEAWRGGPLVWATAGESAAAGAGEGCAAVLLTASWALLTTRCLKGHQPSHLTLIAPGDGDGAAAPAPAGAGADDGGWRQRRRVAEVVRHDNQADKGALEFPALALARVDRPFALGPTLRPAPVLAGVLDDARRPLRCSIEGWEVQKQNKSDVAADSANFTEPTKSFVKTVLTYEQCRANALVEHLPQFCVEVSAPRLQNGSPLLCGGALVGMQYEITRYQTSDYRVFHLFTNASDLQSWLVRNVPKLKLVSNSDGVLTDLAPQHSHVMKSAGARVSAASVESFLPAAFVLLVFCTSVLDHTVHLVRSKIEGGNSGIGYRVARCSPSS